MSLIFWCVFCVLAHFVFVFANNCAYMEYDNLPDNAPFDEVEKALSIAENKSTIIAITFIIVCIAFMISGSIFMDFHNLY